MKVTHENYAKFMFKAIPLLTLAYFIQSYIYLNYGPPRLAQEVVVFLGISLIGIFLYFYLYDHYYKIIFHATYLEIAIRPLKIHRECSYREIMDVEIVEENKSYHNILIYLKNGEKVKLSHVDDAYNIRKFLLDRS